jgi:hypothetical protein
MSVRRSHTPKSELADLQRIPGIGPSIAQDLYDLGIRRVGALKNRNPQLLYDKLIKLRGEHQDRCVLYTFRCAVYFATATNHDPELLKWWNWQDEKTAKPAKRASSQSARKPATKSSSKPPSRRSTTANEFRRLALAQPEAIESSHMNHPDFRVGGKIFASLTLKDHRAMVKLSVDEQRTFLAANPNVFTPASGAWGRQGCTMIRLSAADKSIVRQAVIAAWHNVAPDRIKKQLATK